MIKGVVRSAAVMVLCLSLFSGLFPVRVARAEMPVAKEILEPFRQINVFRGDFEQQKKLPMFANAFVSNGRFLSVRDHGLIWETTTPAPSTLVMTPGKVVQQMNGREQVFQASGTGYDGLGILLPALLDGDLETLKSYFSIRVNGSPSDWTFSLEPRSKELSAIIENVSVTGSDNQFQEITMTGPEGDLTRILFQSVIMSNEVPDAADLARFK